MRGFQNKYRTNGTVNRLSLESWRNMDKLLKFLQKFQGGDEQCRAYNTMVVLEYGSNVVNRTYNLPLFPIAMYATQEITQVKTANDWIKYLHWVLKRADCDVSELKHFNAVQELSFNCRYDSGVYGVEMSFLTNHAKLSRQALNTKTSTSRHVYENGRFVVWDPACRYECTAYEIPTSGHSIHRLFEDLLEKNYQQKEQAHDADLGKACKITPLAGTRLVQT